jgi:hypothetical protein
MWLKRLGCAKLNGENDDIQLLFDFVRAADTAVAVTINVQSRRSVHARISKTTQYA